MISLTVCVEYDDFLQITLPRNVRHFTRTVIVTSPADQRTQRLALLHGCEYCATDAFYRNGAKFNKGLAIEEGITHLDLQDEWLCVWDADIVMPRSIACDKDPRHLYTPIRRILADPTQYHDRLNWNRLASPTRPQEFNGYFQLFHSSIPLRRPWYGVDWRHAGGCDSEFESKWQIEHKHRPPFEVLHLGDEGPKSRIGENWMGRVTPRLDGVILDTADRKRWLSDMITDRSQHGTTKERL